MHPPDACPVVRWGQDWTAVPALPRREVTDHVAKPLVIVESPAKAKTIEGFLGRDRARVIASYGHVRDLPSSAKEMPKRVTDKDVRRLGIDVEDHFTPVYVVPEKKKEYVRALKEALADASELYLATDEDREGEAISWHVLEVLKPKVPVKRMVFHEITRRAIEAAIENWRDLDMKLVEAQEGRRILDRLDRPRLNLRVIRQENKGPAAARNRGISAGSAPYVLCLDADDTIQPSFLMQAVIMTFGFLPSAWRRSAKALMTGLKRRALRAAMYRLERTVLRPTRIQRRPRMEPLSQLKGATPTRAEIFARLRCPNSGMSASSVALVPGPMPGAL